MARMVRHDAGFRKPEAAYFDWVLSIRKAERQASPFIVVLNGDTHAVVNVDRLTTYPDQTEVLQAWPGKYRTDIFQFKVIDLVKYIQEGK